MQWSLGSRSLLSVVVVGTLRVATWGDDHHAKLRRLRYVRGEQIDAFGNRSMMAVRIESQLVRFVEPESGIIDVNKYYYP